VAVCSIKWRAGIQKVTPSAEGNPTPTAGATAPPTNGRGTGSGSEILSGTFTESGRDSNTLDYRVDRIATSYGQWLDGSGAASGRSSGNDYVDTFEEGKYKYTTANGSGSGIFGTGAATAHSGTNTRSKQANRIATLQGRCRNFTRTGCCGIAQ